jgi:hexulose-6-phosphate isomerase
MQGRLSPPENGQIQAFPRQSWRQEFPLAAEAGLDFIEWIFDVHGHHANPIETDEGVHEVAALCSQNHVSVVSLCADYFMERPLVRATDSELNERLATLDWLMHRSRMLGVSRIVLPFVDSSRIDSVVEMLAVCRTLEHALESADRTGLEIHLETSLAPGPFAEMLARLPHPRLRVNYDTGNSSCLGFVPAEEFASYGERVGSVHIKDRKRNGGTVPLGEGDTDFVAVFECLRQTGFSGDFTLQVARDRPGRETNWAAQNRAFVLAELSRGC